MYTRSLRAADIPLGDPDGGGLIRLDQLAAAQLHAKKHFPAVTLQMYHESDLLDLGLIGYAMTSSGTVGKALEIAVKYHDLTSERYELQLFEHSRWAIVRQLPFLNHLGEYIDIGEELAGVCKILSALLGDRVNYAQVTCRFGYPEPAYRGEYEKAFPGTCKFDADHSEIQFPAKWLEMMVTTANSDAAAVCASICERVIGTGTRMTSFAEATKRLLVSRAGREMLSLAEAAGELRLSVSQLRKRLYKESTSYKQVVLEVRMTLARHYLEVTSLSVQEIAYLLDYSQAAAFSRAYKLYFGHSPRKSRPG